MQQMCDDTRGTGAVSSTSCKVTELGTGLGVGRPPAVAPASPAGRGRGPNAAGKARRAGSGLHLLFFCFFNRSLGPGNPITCPYKSISRDGWMRHLPLKIGL